MRSHTATQTEPGSEAGAAPLLEVDQLEVSLDQGTGSIVNGVSFTVNQAECVAIVGESGSGKSMTLKALLGLQPRVLRRHGTINLEGQRLDTKSEAEMREIRGQRIGLVPQDPFTSLNPVRRIGAQIADVLTAHQRLDRHTVRQRALEVINAVGLSDPERRLRQYPHELSGGMRQRVVIGLALACEPDIILADEPTTALDVTVQAQILELLDELREARQVSVILVTHDLGVVRERAARVIVMYAGQVVESGPTETIFNSPRAPYTRALLGSLPSLHTGGKDLPEIPGGPPDPAEPLPGCRFAPRCSQVITTCTNEEPALEAVSTTRELRCFNPPAPQTGDEEST